MAVWIASQTLKESKFPWTQTLGMNANGIAYLLYKTTKNIWSNGVSHEMIIC